MSNTRVLIFIIILSLACALILSYLASALAKPQAIAKELDRSTQMLLAARIVSHEGNFLVQTTDGKHVPAKYLKDGILIPSKTPEPYTQNQVLEVYRRRIKPFLVNNKGEQSTFEKQNLNELTYLQDNRKTGYYRQPWKLIYEILPNPGTDTDDKLQAKAPKVEGYVIPVSGYGLWDAIYGYLAIKTDGDTVIGTSWYDQKETPGLGANITEADWQNQFQGKKIFQPSASGKTDFKTALLGLTVVKGKVSEVYGNSPKAESAIDGMAGATLTGNGVTSAYQDVLAEYRPFLLKLHEKGSQ